MEFGGHFRQPNGLFISEDIKLYVLDSAEESIVYVCELYDGNHTLVESKLGPKFLNFILPICAIFKMKHID